MHVSIRASANTKGKNHFSFKKDFGTLKLQNGSNDYIYIYACQEKCTFEPFLSQENVAALKVSHHQSLQKPLEPPMSKHEARDRLLKGPCTTLGVDK